MDENIIYVSRIPKDSERLVGILLGKKVKITEKKYFELIDKSHVIFDGSVYTIKIISNEELRKKFDYFTDKVQIFLSLSFLKSDDRWKARKMSVPMADAEKRLLEIVKKNPEKIYGEYK